MNTLWIFCIMAFLCLMETTHAAKSYDHGVDLPTKRPLNIGHRGSSGVLPEHTAESYRQAIEDSADVIECDVVVTSDLHLVCRHEPFLGLTTDVGTHQEFTARKRTIEFDNYGVWENITDWYVSDFTLAELKKLRVYQTNKQRDQSHNGKYQIPTFVDYIKIAKDADRKIGIYPELKHPHWFNSLDIFNDTTFEDLLVTVLEENGYTSQTDPCFVQSYEFKSVQYLSTITDLPLIILVDYSYGSCERGLEEFAQICYGIGIWKCSFVDYWNSENGYKNYIKNSTECSKKVHDLGMKIHVYTFRNENSDLAWDFAQDPMKEFEYYDDLGVDGYFVDFPATFDRYLDSAYAEEETCEKNLGQLKNANYIVTVGATLLAVSLYRGIV